MNIGGTISKLERNLDKIGFYGGIYFSLQNIGKQWGLDAMGAGMHIVQKIAEEPHLPNIEHVIDALTKYDESKVFMPAAKAAVVGYLMKEANVHPTVSRIGRALEKGGVGVAKACALVTLLQYAGVHHSQSSAPSGASSSGGNSETWRYQP